MRRALFALIALLALAAPSYAVDDCPPGHVRHPAISALDDAAMVEAFTASFRGIFGREPTMKTGAGVDDGWYYIRAANHYGVYGDDQCHAGWSAYWESWVANGHGDLKLVQTPAKFQPTASLPVVPTPVIVAPPATPIVVPPAPLPSTDLSPVLNAISLAQAQTSAALAEIRSELDAAAKDIHELRAEVESTWKQYVAPLVKYGLAIAAGFLAKAKL